MRRNPVADAIADRHGAVAAGVGQDDGELVAAEAGDDVGLAGARADHPAASTSARLPDRCPWVSFTDLKPSRSMKSSDSGRPLRDGALGFPPQHLRQVPRVVELSQVVGDGQRLGPLHP